MLIYAASAPDKPYTHQVFPVTEPAVQAIMHSTAGLAGKWTEECFWSKTRPPALARFQAAHEFGFAKDRDEADVLRAKLYELALPCSPGVADYVQTTAQSFVSQAQNSSARAKL